MSDLQKQELFEQACYILDFPRDAEPPSFRSFHDYHFERRYNEAYDRGMDAKTAEDCMKFINYMTAITCAYVTIYVEVYKEVAQHVDAMYKIENNIHYTDKVLKNFRRKEEQEVIRKKEQKTQEDALIEAFHEELKTFKGF